MRFEHGFIQTPVFARRRKNEATPSLRSRPCIRTVKITSHISEVGLLSSQIVSYGFIFHCAKCMNIRAGASLEKFEGIP